MRIKDIGCRLDMKLKILINDTSDIFRWSKLHNLVIGLFIKRDSNSEKYYFEAFITKANLEKHARELIESYGPIETENYYLISRPIVNKKMLDFIKQLWNVPSLQFSELTIENGKMILRIRFNNLYKENVSLILNRYLEIPYFIEDITLTRSEDVIFLMAKKNRRAPVSVIQYSLPIGAHKIDYPTEILMEGDSLAEVVESPYDKSNFRVVIFSQHKLEEKSGLKCLSSKDMIYQTESTNELLNMIKDRANEHGIYRANIIIKYRNGKLYSSSVISTQRLNEYLQIMFSCSKEIYGKNIIDLSICSDFDANIYGDL
jgi:hypothetical protein